MYPLLFSDFNETLIFSRDSRKILKILIFINIRLVGSELIHVTDRHDEASSRLSQFWERA